MVAPFFSIFSSIDNAVLQRFTVLAPATKACERKSKRRQWPLCIGRLGCAEKGARSRDNLIRDFEVAGTI